MSDPIRLNWLEGTPPSASSAGTTFGVPFPRGEVGSAGAISVTDARGETVAAQAWPTATWPDGSLKWAGIAIGALAEPTETLTVHTDRGVGEGGAAADATGAADDPGSARPRATMRS